MTTLADWLQRSPLVAILRGVKPTEVLAIGQALVDAGIRIIEVPLNSPQPEVSIAALAQTYGERVLVGAGTVLDQASVDRVAQAGGKLIVMPHADPVVVRAARQAGLIAMPGFATPTEAFAALAAGADGLKLFPAEAFQPSIMKAFAAVLPKGVKMLPVGGMDATTIPAWRAAGAAGFGIGSAIYRPGDTAEVVAAKALGLLAALD